jgi:hypothetical protein
MRPATSADPAAGRGTGLAGPVHSARWLYIDSGREAVVYLDRDAEVCKDVGSRVPGVQATR